MLALISDGSQRESESDCMGNLHFHTHFLSTLRERSLMRKHFQSGSFTLDGLCWWGVSAMEFWIRTRQPKPTLMSHMFIFLARSQPTVFSSASFKWVFDFDKGVVWYWLARSPGRVTAKIILCIKSVKTVLVLKARFYRSILLNCFSRFDKLFKQSRAFI